MGSTRKSRNEARKTALEKSHRDWVKWVKRVKGGLRYL
jgi:hypothetical protein